MRVQGISRRLWGALGRMQQAAQSLGRIGTRRMRGLHGEVEILTDNYGVPHIYAQHREDVFFAQGYVTARDRLFQLDYNRHGARGRLCELVGRQSVPWQGLTVHLKDRTTLDVDVMLRTFGLEEAARRSLEICSPEARLVLDAYTAGVNAYLARQPWSLEHRILRLPPKPWTNLDSVVLIKAIAFELNYAWRAVLMGGMLSGAGLSDELLRVLWPNYPAGGPTIVDPQRWRAVAEGLSVDTQTASQVTGMPGRPGEGSNSYAVAASRSATGRALLANDTHLTLTAPLPWHEVRLSGGGIDVAGFALAGVPGVGIGRNPHGVWGITAGLVHDLDLFLEEVDPAEPTRYRTPDGWATMSVREEVFRVRGEGHLRRQIGITRHGPVLETVGPALEEKYRLAVCWTGHEPSSEIDALLEMWSARSLESFDHALRHHGCPTFNMVWAGNDGRIGYVLAGKLPRRPKDAPLRPLEGWTGEWDWQGYVPYDENPRAHDPEGGVLVTANNRVASWDYAHELGRLFEPPYRFARISELLAQRDKHTLEDLAQMQLDNAAGWAVAMRDRLLQLVGGAAGLGNDEASQVLATWDGKAEASSAGAALAYATAFALAKRLLVRLAGEDAAWALIELSAFMGPPLLELLHKQDLLAPHGINLAQEITAAFGEAQDMCREASGPKVSGWRWGDLHPLVLTHRFTDTPLGGWLNIGPEPAAGGPDTVNRGDINANRDHRLKLGPAMRMVAEAKPGAGLRTVLPAGQSGARLSPHYDDQTRLFLRGELRTVPWNREAVTVETRERWRPS